MSLVLVRIDDRLIHGQVVVGWCSHVKPDRIVLCDDEIAQSEVDRAIYEEAACDYPVSICTIEQAAQLLKSASLKDEKIILIVGSPGAVVKLLDCGVDIRQVNVGGMHYKEGKRKITPFVYVDDEDVRHFRWLAERDVKLEARDLPGSKPIDLTRALGL